jgi:ribosomal protein L36
MQIISLKKRNDVLKLMRKKRFVMVIVKKEQTVLGNLYLI